MDDPQLHGLWKLESRVSCGSVVHDSASHYHFENGRFREICPDLVDDGKLRSFYEVDMEHTPPRIVITHDYNGPDGPPDPDPIREFGIYHVAGNKLELCFGSMDEFPTKLSAETETVVTMSRDPGPIPEGKQPSGTPPLVDEVLGTLEWEDNYGWYRGAVNAAGFTFDLSLNPDQENNVCMAVSRARQIIERLEHYRQMAAEYAVAGLLDLKNDAWLDENENELSADEFKAKMTLESISVEADGDVTFWHNDGDLFWGHSIQVCIDSHDDCTSTDIPG